MKRELIDRAPIDAALAGIVASEEAARRTPGGETAATAFGSARKLLEAALANAVRLPEEGMTPAEYAERHGYTRWAVYKKIERGELKVIRRGNGQILVQLAA